MKTLVSAAAVAALAGSAFGLGETLDRSNYRILTVNTPGVTFAKAPLDGTSRAPLSGQGTAVYGWDDNTPTSGGPGTIGGAGFIASAAGTGVLGAEDYGSTLSASGPPNGSPSTQADTMNVISYEFVGGVQQVGGIVFFDFFFNNLTTANSFGLTFPSAGNFVWSITFAPSALTVPTEGFHQLVANTNPALGPVTTGQWFLSDTGAGPVVGHNDTAFDNGTFNYGTATTPDVRSVGHLFALGVPTPGTAALMGLAGLAGMRRRRNR